MLVSLFVLLARFSTRRGLELEREVEEVGVDAF
jgi:hypothetical protein